MSMKCGNHQVSFLFTRNEDNTHDGGAGSNDNDTDSAWVDVLTPWAGEGYGARFLPRVVKLLLSTSLMSNINRPLSWGASMKHNVVQAEFDNTGKLPDTKKLAGIRSKRVKARASGNYVLMTRHDQKSIPSCKVVMVQHN